MEGEGEYEKGGGGGGGETESDTGLDKGLTEAAPPQIEESGW